MTEDPVMKAISKVSGFKELDPVVRELFVTAFTWPSGENGKKRRKHAQTELVKIGPSVAPFLYPVVGLFDHRRNGYDSNESISRMEAARMLGEIAKDHELPPQAVLSICKALNGLVRNETPGYYPSATKDSGGFALMTALAPIAAKTPATPEAAENFAKYVKAVYKGHDWRTDQPYLDVLFACAENVLKKHECGELLDIVFDFIDDLDVGKREGGGWAAGRIKDNVKLIARIEWGIKYVLLDHYFRETDKRKFSYAESYYTYYFSEQQITEALRMAKEMEPTHPGLYGRFLRELTFCWNDRKYNTQVMNGFEAAERAGLENVAQVFFESGFIDPEDAADICFRLLEKRAPFKNPDKLMQWIRRYLAKARELESTGVYTSAQVEALNRIMATYYEKVVLAHSKKERRMEEHPEALRHFQPPQRDRNGIFQVSSIPRPPLKVHKRALLTG